ncbi:MAG TPA: hypothetical protein VFP60_03680 [Pseudolabrys sp.]|nr:hypothetical protein [Pseudolabrys sp.]
MRIVLVVACAAAFVFSAWSNLPTSADTKQRTNWSIDTLGMMTTTTNLPTEEFDAF